MKPTLYDLLLRQALLVEGLKVERRSAFGLVANTLRKTLRDILRGVDTENIGDLTKAKLSVLLADTQSKVKGVFNDWIEETLDWVEEFGDVNIDLTKVLIASYEESKRQEGFILLPPGNAIAWYDRRQESGAASPLFGWVALNQRGGYSRIGYQVRTRPMAAGGNGVVDLLNGLVTASTAAITSDIRAAWADGKTPAELQAELVGTGGRIDRVVNNANAVTNTVVQQTSQLTNAVVQSASADRYIWVSVIDAVTSDICRSRNGKIYVFGSGPLPPAHMNCRSHIVSLMAGESGDNFPASFYTWVSAQPVAFLREVFDAETAEALKNGTAKKSSFDKFKASKPMTLRQFSNSASTIATA